MFRFIFSVHRRHRLANIIFSLNRPTIRLCVECARRDLFYIIHKFSELCEQCERFSRVCDLTFPVTTIEKLARQENDILNQISLTYKVICEAEAKIARFWKQRRLLFKKIKDFGDREAQNIFELKVEKMVAETFSLKLSSDDFPLPNLFQIFQSFPNRIPVSPFRNK